MGFLTALPVLSNFLLNVTEQIAVKKIFQCDVEAVAKLLQRGNRDAVISSADNVVHGLLCDPAAGAQFVEGQVPLLAQLENPHPHRLANVHGFLPLYQELRKRISIFA